MDWGKLQNGSDIRGVAMEGIKGEAVNLTPEVAFRLGQSFTHWLKLKNMDHDQFCVGVGTDSRLSGPALKKEFIDGTLACGADVADCGMASTPAMFMITQHEDLLVDAGVMLTASHLPFNRNGFKFFTKKGGLDKKDIREILEIAEFGKVPKMEEGHVRELDFISRYARAMADQIRSGVNADDYMQPLKGMKIIVDAGNGAGGFFASKVLKPLGADISGSQFLEPDGHFPNHVPNPEDEEAMEAICAAVKTEHADLGIIFDTDVDRSAIVDNTGKPINRNALIALISAVILEEHPGTTIVTDSVTSDGLAWFINDHLKGKHHRFQRGYKNVINESIRLNREGQESWLAIETSGHAALKENYFLDDGAYLVAKLLIKMARLNEQGRSLPDLIKGLPQAKESADIRPKIRKVDFVEYGNHVISQLHKLIRNVPGWEAEAENYEGIRVRCTSPEHSGWFLVRLSLHDPVLPINIESNVQDGVERIGTELWNLLEAFDGLEIGPFNAWMKR